MDIPSRKKQIAKELGVIAGSLQRATNPKVIAKLENKRAKLKAEWARLSQQDAQE